MLAAGDRGGATTSERDARVKLVGARCAKVAAVAESRRTDMAARMQSRLKHPSVEVGMVHVNDLDDHFRAVGNRMAQIFFRVLMTALEKRPLRRDCTGSGDFHGHAQCTGEPEHFSHLLPRLDGRLDGVAGLPHLKCGKREVWSRIRHHLLRLAKIGGCAPDTLPSSI